MFSDYNMNSSQHPSPKVKYQQDAVEAWLAEDYTRAGKLYEQAIETEPLLLSHYWHLGLMLLLQGQETEAQTTWLMVMMEGEAEEIEVWNCELVEVLQQEAERQEARNAHSLALTLRQNLREIAPEEINNLLSLIGLAVELKTYGGEELQEFRVIELLKSGAEVVSFDLLASVLERVLQYAPFLQSSLDLAEASLSYAKDESKVLRLLNLFLKAAIDISYFKKQPGIAATLCELGLRIAPEQPECLHHLCSFYQDSEQYQKGIETAILYLQISDNFVDEIIARKSLIRALMSTGGHWQEAQKIFEELAPLLDALVENPPTNLTPLQVSRLLNTYFFAPYFRDCPTEDRVRQNQIARIYHMNAEIHQRERMQQYAEGHQQRHSQQTPERRLKIGYLSHCFKAHSVGWLARWVFQYADRENFEIYAYMITSPNTYEPLQAWYAEQVTKTYKSASPEELAEEIYQDKIDILIDVDSITLDCPCAVFALKPAPIQVTWLGWDGSGLPTIDYFIADPYVLPESAKEYYNEKIWRLPATYIAVDGFEVDVPTLRRNDLNIEADAIVYLSSQIGYKRHWDTMRLQMQIVKQVPNSYFLIKGLGELDAMREFFTTLAEEEGFDRERLRFLPSVASETIHRANLTIADIVLDTYPYNGATTTLETLWMGIPLVTRVGEQFAARNSYTMMMNAGITEGIAWTDEEYVGWGVRLGKDETLRKEISWKLKKSRQTAPLWNGKQFTREMEKAYREMWRIYIQS